MMQTEGDWERNKLENIPHQVDDYGQHNQISFNLLFLHQRPFEMSSNACDSFLAPSPCKDRRVYQPCITIAG